LQLSLIEADAAEEIGEPRIAAKGIQPGRRTPGLIRSAAPRSSHSIA
jgi:hypothetical protein